MKLWIELSWLGLGSVVDFWKEQWIFGFNMRHRIY